jgi:N6-L-threonylcarbamoyladenine synthase
MNILAIETSCDETSVAIVEDGQHIHSLVVNSQIDIHKAYGGVVPEIAARSHIEVILPVIDQALGDADMTWDNIDAIAVTQGPGLLGSLLIGVLTARTLAFVKKKPLYPVHHILGHIYANWIKSGPEYKTPYPLKRPEFPVLALIVSGGHSQLMYGENHTNWKVIGRTHDDAVGEAFDKVAKVLGLPYPGGVSISIAAKDGNPDKYTLPTPKVDDKYGYSFSGLKTALLRLVQKECGKDHTFPSFELANLLSKQQVADFSASFQAKAIEYLVSKTRLAYDDLQPKSVIIGGGVAASLPLREAISSEIPIEVEYAPQILCTDNAAMIGAQAYYLSQSEKATDPNQVEVKPSWPL